MATLTFVASLKHLFLGYIQNEDFDLQKFKKLVDHQDVKGNPQSYYKVFYNQYNFKTNENYDIGTPIFPKEPINITFGKDSFWFKETTPAVKLNPGEVMGFKDGVREIFRAGEYLEGGEVYDFQIKQKDPNLRSEEDLAKPTEFIHAFFNEKNRKSTNNIFHLIAGRAVTHMRHLPGIRIYFNFKKNLSPNDLQSFFKFQIINFLNKRAIPFQLKIPYSYENFTRRDNCVLYLAQAHFWLIREQLFNINDKFSNYFEENLPLFVHELYQGIGLAEDPIAQSEFSDGNESFGENRINILLSCILKAISDTKTSYSINELKIDLEGMGYDIVDFFRNPNTTFKYEKFGNDKVNTLRKVSPLVEKRSYQILEVDALEIGFKLLQKAHYGFSNSSIGWASINEAGKYSYLDQKDKNEVLLFLTCLCSVGKNAELFPKTLLELLSKNNLNGEQNYLDYWKKEYWQNWTTAYTELKDFKELRSYLTAPVTIFTAIKKSTKVLLNRYFGNNPRVIEEVYHIERKDFETKKLRDIVWKIHNSYSKKDYPIPNRFDTFDFDPLTITKIGFMFLFVYCPAVFPKKKPN